MLRYIDVDKLLESLQEELDYYPLLYTREQNEWFDKGLKRALRIVKTFPTADVVPKSEYDWVVSAVDNSTNEFLKLHDDYQKQKVETDKWKQLFYDAKKLIDENSQRALKVTLEEIEKAKAEVAREIFEEIESKKMFLKDCAGNMGVVVLFKDISELKKKYTEEKE